MVQVFGILGFIIAFLAIILVGEFRVRTSQRLLKLEANLAKSMARIQIFEDRLLQIDRITTEIHDQKVRQSQTLTALASKGDDGVQSANSSSPEPVRRPRRGDAGNRFVPSEYKAHQSG
ncbi:MAG: hypothetical protein JKY17_03535 [Magnetovibrio sp.]|nr:hypothetical protein [Magnetovibrio sp.]